VDDNFVTWPHRPERLERFLDLVNGFHQNIQFTMETLIFTGDWMAYRATRFTGNLLNTNLSLNSESHYQPFNKHAVLSTLVLRARLWCDPEILLDEFEVLKYTFV
jgi:hypothetical protein